VISINPGKHKATIVGIPRDSWVTIPDHGASKINASLVDGGPDLLVRTIESLSGLTIDYWAITTFWGITALVDDLGGLTVDVPFSMSDPYSRSDFQPGVQRLEGSQVLAFARDRHSFNQGDFARSENGGRVLLAMLAQFRKGFQRDQSTLFTWISAGMRNVETSVPLSEALDLAFTVSHVNPKGVTNTVLPGTSGSEGGLSVVFLSSAKDAIFSDIRPDGILSKRNRPPSPTATET
jgi:LCP family protein required for cell wall assembly